MNNFYFHGGPTWLEWVAGLCDKVNELITAINNINNNGVKNPHKLTFTGDVDATYDGSEDVTVDISGGGGGGGGESDKLWYPYIVEKVLNWRKTTSTTTPTPFDLNQLKGDKGSDGYSPTASVTQTATGATITITDKTGTTTAKVKNGTDGTDGTNGTDGFSPSAKVTTTPDGARITITDKTGTTTADVTNGSDGSDGATGPAGAAAGFGVVDATATTGSTAGAIVTTDGPDTAKNMHFAFTIPAGPYTDIEIGSVTTGEPGTNAEATFDTSTPGVALLDLKIPRGTPGADGATGPAGHDGAPGSAAGFGVVDATATTGTTARATVTTDGPDTAKNMHFAFTIPTGGGGGGGGGDKPIVYPISTATVTGSSIASQHVEAQVVQIGKQLIIRGYLLAVAESTVAAVTGIDLKFSRSVPSLPSTTSSLRFNNAGFYISETKMSNTLELAIEKHGNEYLLQFRQGTNVIYVTTSSDGEQGFFYMVVFLE